MRIAYSGLLAVLMSACGSGDPASYTATAPNAGQLHVEQVIVGKTAYVEGALSYIRIEAEHGEKLIEETLPNVERPMFAARLDPGTYGVVTWHRPCDGSCDRLGNPTDESAARVRIWQNETVRATISVSPGLGCTIDVGGTTS